MLPPDVLEDLRCNTCHNFLSVLPVYSYGGEQHVCGRCPVQEEFAPQRNYLYEMVIQNLDFPCQYEMRGCTEKTIPKGMKLHESTCSFRLIPCPINLDLKKCDYRGSTEDLTQHFQEQHPDKIFKNVELNIINMYEENYLYWMGSDTFMITLKCNSSDKLLYLQVKYLNGKSNFDYTVLFSSKYNDKIFKAINEVVFTDSNHIDVEKPYVTLNTIDLLNILNNPAIIFCNITIQKKKAILKRDITEIENSLLLTIECPVCFCHMVPPILQCSMGHSFCEGCHKKLEICPMCRQSMSHTRNIVLEDLANKIKYPCRYQTYDCNYSGTSNEIRLHEKNCTYGPFTCFFDGCVWKDNFDRFLKHLQEDHCDDFLDLTTINCFIDCDFEENIYVVHKFGNIFKVHFKRNVIKFFWRLELVGPETDPSKYALEIDIKSDYFERIYYKKACNGLTESEDMFITGDAYIEINADSLKDLIVDNMLTYNCFIAQV